MPTDKEFLDENSLDFEEDEINPSPPKETLPKKDHTFKPKKTKEEIVEIQKKKRKEESTKKLISISYKNKKVLEILKNIGKEYSSDSEYICQAIMEKYEKDNSFEKREIKDAVEEILSEMIGKNYIILKSSNDVVSNTNISQEKNNLTEIPKNDNDSENKNLILNSLEDWDE